MAHSCFTVGVSMTWLGISKIYLTRIEAENLKAGKWALKPRLHGELETRLRMRQGCRIRNLRTMLTKQCQVEQTKTITLFVDLSQPFPPYFACPRQNPSASNKASMCKITWEKHRCGHKTMVGTPD